MIEDTLQHLRSLGGAVETILDEGPPYHRVTFPKASGADYRFYAYVYDDGQAGISARRNNAEEEEDFWYLSLEELDYQNTAALREDFLRILEKVLGHRTRITQRRGMIFGSFECEFLDGEVWRSVGGTSFLRVDAQIPAIEGRAATYHSSAPLHNADLAK